MTTAGCGKTAASKRLAGFGCTGGALSLHREPTGRDRGLFQVRAQLRRDKFASSCVEITLRLGFTGQNNQNPMIATADVRLKAGDRKTQRRKDAAWKLARPLDTWSLPGSRLKCQRHWQEWNE